MAISLRRAVKRAILTHRRDFIAIAVLIVADDSRLIHFRLTQDERIGLSLARALVEMLALVSAKPCAPICATPRSQRDKRATCR